MTPSIRLILLAVTLAAPLAAHGEDPPSAAAPPHAANTPTKAATAPASKKAATAAAAPAHDRLELDTTEVTGNRELPKVLVIVPWKKADLGDLAGKPLNSLVDDALQPLDRDVFRREIDYHAAVSREATGASPGAGSAPAADAAGKR